MTCIAAIAENGCVYMAADSAGVAGLSLNVRADPKIYRIPTARGDMLLGFTSSFRMGQILGYHFDPPQHPRNIAVSRYMVTDFVTAVRAVLKEHGFAKTQNNEDTGGTFLVGYCGSIFRVCDDFQVGKNVANYDAVGSGGEVALGSLYTTDQIATSEGDVHLILTPRQRLSLALHAAEEFNAGVRRPFLQEAASS